MQAKRSSRGSNTTLPCRSVIILNSKLLLCCIFRGWGVCVWGGLTILHLDETHRLALKLRKARRLQKCLFLSPFRENGGSEARLILLFLLFLLQPIRSRLPCAPFGSERVSGRRLVISVRSALLSRTSKSTAQDTNTVRVCPVRVCLTHPREELFN